MGQSVAVPDDTEDVYLDLTNHGVVRGRVETRGGEVHRCAATAERVAADVSDLGSIGVAGRIKGSCGVRPGEFQISGLPARDWIGGVEARFGDERGLQFSTVVPVAALAEGEPRDVGMVDVQQGSSLEVHRIDGLTGDELDDLPAFLVHDGAGLEVGYATAVRCGSAVAPALPSTWQVYQLPYAGAACDRATRLSA